MGAGGLGMLLPLLLRFGWKGALVIGAIFLLVTRFTGGGSDSQQKAGPDEARSFVGFVTDDTQQTWAKLFQQSGKQYTPARVVLYTEAASTGCGFGEAAVGPFYCPRDQKVYLDVSFFRALQSRLGAPGDFAQAYVIAHEIGHHVQRQQGVNAQVERAPEGARTGANGLSVRAELQADCYAGVWAHSASQRDLLEVGDLDEAIGAASAVGDDRLQKSSTGTVQPERWTHGSAESRARWFKKGYTTGNPAACDTFNSPTL
jgi:uncharacterized protein